MAIVYNGTTLQKIIYDGVDLDKVYYDGVLVFVKPIVYNGGDGSSLFADKSIRYNTNDSTTFYIRGVEGGGNSYNSPNFSNMTMDVQSHASVNLTHRGGIWVVCNKKFDISTFSTLTFVVTYWSDPWNSRDNNNNYPSIRAGVSTSCERAGTGTTNGDGNTYYKLGGTQYYQQQSGSGLRTINSTQMTITCDLTTAKQNGSEFYPYLQIHHYRSTNYGDDSGGRIHVYVQINSIIFS